MAGAADEAVAEGAEALRQGRAVDARRHFEDALSLAPGHLAARINLATALWTLGLRDAAEETYRQVLVDAPGHPAATQNLTRLVTERLSRAEARGAPKVELDLAGLDASQLLARADALQAVGRLAEALEACRAAAEAEPLRPAALLRAANLQAMLGRHPDALATLDQAVALSPDEPQPRHRRSFTRLLLGDYAGGWKDYEHRLLSPASFQEAGALGRVMDEVVVHPSIDQLAGRRVLLVAEQGIGDQVMFASMIPDLARVAGEVICVCDRRLAGLFGRSFPGVRVLGAPGAKVASSEYDVVVAMGSLGRVFRNRPTDFPGTPFLTADPERVAQWTARLGPRPRRVRIGLSWQGGLPQTGRQRRSLSLAQLTPILSLPDCDFVSLQYGDVAAEVAAANRALPIPIQLFEPQEIADVDDLAALTQAVDVVVSVQNALVHLAGGLGKDCLTLLPHNPEWRYTLGAETMPWYRSVRLFRQPYVGDWIPVVQRVAQALAGQT